MTDCNGVFCLDNLVIVQIIKALTVRHPSFQTFIYAKIKASTHCWNYIYLLCEYQVFLLRAKCSIHKNFFL